MLYGIFRPTFKSGMYGGIEFCSTVHPEFCIYVLQNLDLE